jgi:HAD superfamily hydrolase (TIGR01509 family)
VSSPRVAAVVFDMDGVIVDTEPLWNEVKREVATAAGGRWEPRAETEMLGMSGPEWAAYLHDEMAVPLAPAEIARRVVAGMVQRLSDHVPVLPGAPEAVAAIAARWPIALASSADRPVIEAVLDHAGIAAHFTATVTSEEAGRGKPAPDAYLEAARRLGVAPEAAVAVEDSPNGMRSAAAAGMALVAVPNPSVPAEPDALALAGVVLDGGVAALTPAVVERAAAARAV